MPRYRLDTNHLTLLERQQVPFLIRFLGRRADAVTGIVNAQEVLKGRLAASAAARKPADVIRGYELLDLSISTLAQIPIFPFDAIAEGAFQTIRAARPRVGTQDQRIAAIALGNGLTLVTRNTQDFVGIPGLSLDDWSV
jgi:tRNA(fMet)-specific endonuclease VapC